MPGKFLFPPILVLPPINLWMMNVLRKIANAPEIKDLGSSFSFSFSLFCFRDDDDVDNITSLVLEEGSEKGALIDCTISRLRRHKQIVNLTQVICLFNDSCYQIQDISLADPKQVTTTFIASSPF